MRTDNWTQTEGFDEDYLTLLDYMTKHKAPIEDINTIEFSTTLKDVLAMTKSECLEIKNCAEIVVQSVQSANKPLAVSLIHKPKQQHSLRNQTIQQAVVKKPPLKTFSQAPSKRNFQVRSTPSESSRKNIPTAKAPLVQRKPPNRSKTVIDISSRNNNNAIEDIDSSTSTLKASNETIFGSSSRKLGLKAILNNKTCEEGEWLTVKNKRRSSLHWHQTRFNKPSSTASLPTLTLLDESIDTNEKDDPKVILSGNRAKMNEKKFKEFSEKKVKAKVDSNIKGITEKSGKIINSTSSSLSKPRHKASNLTKPRLNTTQGNSKNSSKPAILDHVFNTDQKVLRQRSDLTGLKLKSLNKEYLKSERSQIAVLEQKKKAENTGDLYIDKVDMKIQTSTSLISNTIDRLYMECFEVEKEQDKIKHRNGDLSSCDELEEKDEFESDDDQKKMLEEQVENLERQIRELENTGKVFRLTSES